MKPEQLAQTIRRTAEPNGPHTHEFERHGITWRAYPSRFSASPIYIVERRDGPHPIAASRDPAELIKEIDRRTKPNKTGITRGRRPRP